MPVQCGTDIYLLLYLQHVNQRHLISQRAYNYILDSLSYFYIRSASLSFQRMAETPKQPEHLKFGALCDFIDKQRAPDNAHQTVSSKRMRRQGRRVPRNKPSSLPESTSASSILTGRKW